MKKSDKKAVAVSYHPDFPAPILESKGSGFWAQRILEIAKKENIEVVEDSDLAQALVSLPAGQYIPEEFFRVLASIYAVFYDNEKRGLRTK